MDRPVALEHLRYVALWVRRDSNELHPVFHRSIVDHSLDLSDPVSMERAYIGTAGINEMQHDHFPT